MSSMGRISGQLLKDNLLRDLDLDFKNESSDTSLIHLGVNTRNVGINTESPSDALEVETQILSTNLDNEFSNIAKISIEYTNNGGNEIRANSGDLTFDSAGSISISSLATDDINFNNNVITTTTNNTNLEIRPEGSGTFEIQSNLNIVGSLYTPNNIRFNSGFIVGDSENDTVIINADIESNLNPDVNNSYNLGSASKKWLNLYSDLLNGQKITVDEITLENVALARRQGNIFYVSKNGNDSNVGDHQHGAFRTIKHALGVVDASSFGPVTIKIFPGEYEEEFPLIVPERVTLQGTDLRNTVIKPTSATQNNDVLLLNQNCLIENLTIKDFYSPGYAFRFENGTRISERSPYIKNVTVITSGSVTSVSDPRGFDQGDAGRGALIDGNETDWRTNKPSMLFESATFITPGVDTLVITNGARVEWLSSFTYFANRGFYATQGTGRLSPDGSTFEFGAEIRSIASANIYGNFAAVADGIDTLMYLVSHNFSYVGSGKDITNDKTLMLVDQEIVEINQGRIYYTSTDATGTFRVGDAFFVDYEDGSTNIDISNVNFSGISSIFINSAGEITYIDGDRIDIGNLRFSGNTISSTTGDIIWSPTTRFFNIDNNPGFLVARGNSFERRNNQGDIRYNTELGIFEGFTTVGITLGGIFSEDKKTNINTDDEASDIVFTVNDVESVRFSGNYINLDDSSLGQFGLVELKKISNGNIEIESNTITTTDSNSDLELVPNGASYTKLEDIYVYSNIIENFENTNLALAVNGRGYVKIDSTGATVIPYGDTSTRTITPEVGDTRYNQDDARLEVWNGTEWQRAAGESDEVTESLFNDIMDIYTLILG